MKSKTLAKAIEILFWNAALSSANIFDPRKDDIVRLPKKVVNAFLHIYEDSLDEASTNIRAVFCVDDPANDTRYYIFEVDTPEGVKSVLTVRIDFNTLFGYFNSQHYTDAKDQEACIRRAKSWINACVTL